MSNKKTAYPICNPSSLWNAAFDNNLPEMKRLTQLTDTSHCCVFGRSTLMVAVLMSSDEAVALLLPSSNALLVDENGITALIYAAMRGDRRMVELLMPVSNVLAENSYGENASMSARKFGNNDIAGLIDAYILAKEEREELSLITTQVPVKKSNTRL